MSIHLGKWMGCFLAVVVPLLPLCCGGFGGMKALPPLPKPPGQIESATDSKNILYNCLQKQVCECGLYPRFDTCWAKLPDRIQRFVIDGLNECELPEKVEYGTFKAWAAIACPVERNLSKACYDSLNPKVMQELVASGAGKKGMAESGKTEETRKCMEPTVTFCSEYPDKCLE